MSETPLKSLHASLISSKIAIFEKFTTDKLIQSLVPGQEHSLKTRPDGTILDGHHRVHVLRVRNINVEILPREVREPDRD
jgi:hypothetical protein